MNFDHLEVHRGAPAAAHASGHASAFEHAPGGGSGADGAGRAMAVALPVGARAAAEAVPFDDACEAFAFGDALHVDAVADAEDFARLEQRAELDLAELLGFDAEFAQGAERAVAAGVPALGLGHAPVGDRAEAELDGGVAIALGGFELGDGTGADFEHGAADDAAVLADDLHHAELFAEETGYGHERPTA